MKTCGYEWCTTPCEYHQTRTIEQKVEKEMIKGIALGPFEVSYKRFYLPSQTQQSRTNTPSIRPQSLNQTQKNLANTALAPNMAVTCSICHSQCPTSCFQAHMKEFCCHNKTCALHKGRIALEDNVLHPTSTSSDGDNSSPSSSYESTSGFRHVPSPARPRNRSPSPRRAGESKWFPRSHHHRRFAARDRSPPRPRSPPAGGGGSRPRGRPRPAAANARTVDDDDPYHPLSEEMRKLNMRNAATGYVYVGTEEPDDDEDFQSKSVPKKPRTPTGPVPPPAGQFREPPSYSHRERRRSPPPPLRTPGTAGYYAGGSPCSPGPYAGRPSTSGAEYHGGGGGGAPYSSGSGYAARPSPRGAPYSATGAYSGRPRPPHPYSTPAGRSSGSSFHGAPKSAYTYRRGRYEC